jgi:predicted nucleic acid-binding protein
MNSSSTNLVYVDAAGWIALVNLRDALHTEAVRIYKQRLQEQCHFATASVVLLEVGNWLSPAPLRGLAIDLLQRIEQSSRIEVVHVTRELYAEGWQLYSNRLDKDWGMIDCISFVIMQERNLTEALTSDHHFEQAGFKVLL